ncbi:MAG: hypothetical protein WC979_03240 [Candidatus Pacearchaeota archaeon]|jgi:hypothetical protein|nr:hypothetical protein [Clostridia bacterium]
MNKRIPTLDEFIFESSNDECMYLFKFESNYTTPDGKELIPAYARLTHAQRNKIANYAAVLNTRGFGDATEISDFMKKENDYKLVSYDDLLVYVKSAVKNKK